jgi:antitoxin Phd
MSWQIYDAKARFSEFVEASLTKGPQVITKRGVEAAVLISIDEWKYLKETARKTIPDPLLDPSGPRNIPLGKRPVLKLRPFPLDDEERQ